jgi:acetolactate synthase-1/2/3 large subunit
VTTPVTGAQAVLDVLRAGGVDHVFCVPGESFMGLINAIYEDPSIRFVSTRHEEGAGFMAAAYARLTGRPTALMATRMVGAGHASIAIHTARQDSTPVIVVFGQVPTGARHREAFQEVDLATVFAGIAKYAVEPPAASRLAELTARAARIAVSGRPGPVVVAVREDLLHESVAAPSIRPIVAPRPAPDPALLDRIVGLLRVARRPAIVVGSGLLAARATDRCVELAEREQIPVLTAWRRPDAFPNDHPLYLGWASLRSPLTPIARLREADLLLLIGTRFGQFTSAQHQLPSPGTRVIHVDLDAEALGAHVQADIGCVADAGLFLDAILDRVRTQPAAPELLADRRAANASDRAAWEAVTVPSHGKARAGYVDQQVVARHLQPLIDAGAILVTDAGNFAGWPARYLRWREPGTFLGPTSGAMGYGIPSAIGAKLARPDRAVVCAVGDGGFMMTGSELETAVREHVPIVVLVYDNQQYGTIRMQQEGDHPGRPLGTRLGPIDFAALAEALGGRGIRVTADDQVEAALGEALAAGRPAVVHLRIDPDQLFVGDDAPPS